MIIVYLRGFAQFRTSQLEITCKDSIDWSKLHCAKKQFPADLLIFTKEIRNEKLHFLCSVE